MAEIVPLIDPVSPGWIYLNDGILLLVFFSPVLSLGWYWMMVALGWDSGAGGSSVSPADNGGSNGNGHSSPDAGQRLRDQEEEDKLHADALALAKGKPDEP
jgi:hypothetical protein